jgi:hypothetical protein
VRIEIRSAYGILRLQLAQMSRGLDVDEGFIAALAARAICVFGAEIVGLSREAALACL